MAYRNIICVAFALSFCASQIVAENGRATPCESGAELGDFLILNRWPPEITDSNRYDIHCPKEAKSADVTRAVHTAGPGRTIRLKIFDGVLFQSGSLTAVSDKLAFLHVTHCQSSRLTGKLPEVGLRNLLFFGVKSCDGMAVKKADFSSVKRLQTVVFFASSIQSIEKGTFADLPSLSMLALEAWWDGDQNHNFVPRNIQQLRKFHCSCEYDWFRDWITTKHFGQTPSTVPDEITYYPVDCTVMRRNNSLSGINWYQDEYSINVD